MVKNSLKTSIKNTIKTKMLSQGHDVTSSGADQFIDSIAESVATNVTAYVQAELNKLKLALVTPGAYTGSGTGVVTVNATGLNGYQPTP